MNAVGIDISKGKSMVAALRPMGEVALLPKEYRSPILNPLFIKQSGRGSIRKVKIDKANAMKIAKYGLDNWVDLREYTLMDTLRQQLKLCSCQYHLYTKTIVALQNNLIPLTDKTNELYTNPERADGHRKWVDFVISFWHCGCICRVSENALPSDTKSGASARVIISA